MILYDLAVKKCSVPFMRNFKGKLFYTAPVSLPPRKCALGPSVPIFGLKTIIIPEICNKNVYLPKIET